MRLLFDSHILLWTLYEPERLTSVVRHLVEDPDNELFVSLASVWELSNKVSMNRLPLAGSSPERMLERMEGLDVTFLPITREDILASADLPRHHADPFDRMLIAQALSLSLSLLTKDADMRRYDVPIFWR